MAVVHSRVGYCKTHLPEALNHYLYGLQTEKPKNLKIEGTEAIITYSGIKGRITVITTSENVFINLSTKEIVYKLKFEDKTSTGLGCNTDVSQKLRERITPGLVHWIIEFGSFMLGLKDTFPGISFKNEAIELSDASLNAHLPAELFELLLISKDEFQPNLVENTSSVIEFVTEKGSIKVSSETDCIFFRLSLFTIQDSTHSWFIKFKDRYWKQNSLGLETPLCWREGATPERREEETARNISRVQEMFNHIFRDLEVPSFTIDHFAQPPS